jgi:type II secretion system protein F
VRSFAYVSLDASGRRKSGFIEAADKEAAIQTITQEGRFVLDISERKQRTHRADAPARSKKVTRDELALFTRRLADLSSAGLPLDRVLQVISEQSESETLSAVCSQVLEDVRGGMPVSDALAKHPKLFSDVFTQTLRAGEASGQFSQVASRLADFQQIEVTRRSQFASALIYPSVLTFAAIGAVVFLIAFVVPRLRTVFDSLGADLPASTKLLLTLGDVVNQHGLLILLGIVGLILGYRAFVATPQGALARDRIVLRLPLMGKVVTKATISRFARILGTLVYGGVPILESLSLAGLAAGNRVIRISTDRVREEVREGSTIASAMKDTDAFPPVLVHMVAIGEETGDLPKMLSRVSDSLDFEVDNGLRRLINVFEPVVIVVMGLMVGFVVLSVLLPIYAAQSAVK